MRFLITIFTFLFIGNTYCQEINFSSNTTSTDSIKSFIFKNYGTQYDFIIAYSESSYWDRGGEEYKILAQKNSSWYFIKHFTKEFKTNRPFISSSKVNSDTVSLLLNKLSDKNFWTLDSLNIQRKVKDDSTATYYSISDGINYRFEILTKEHYRIIESYEPEYFLTVLPEFTNRKTFVECRDIFKSFSKKL